MSPTETLWDNSTPGTMKRTSFRFPGAANCGPDCDAESTTVIGTGADTSTTRSSSRNRIETSPLGEATKPSARLHNVRVCQCVKQRTNGGTVKKGVSAPASSQVPDLRLVSNATSERVCVKSASPPNDTLAGELRCTHPTCGSATCPPQGV